MNRRYLPIKSSRGPDLSEYSGLSEGYLRRLVRSGELRHFRSSPRGKILVHTSWFDEWAEGRERRDRLIPEEVRAFGKELLAR